MPIGNVTSQIFANIYLNELDQFIKHKLKVKYYFRYCDDFVIVHDNRGYLQEKLTQIENFIKIRLSLELHPDKIAIKKFRQGVDFLGYVMLPHYIVLRTKTKRRMFRKLSAEYKAVISGESDQERLNAVVQSYLGILKHCHGHQLEEEIRNNFLNNLFL